MMPMLNIYPENRAKAHEVLNHPWIRHPTRNKDHICMEPVISQANLEAFQTMMKGKDVFFRELKLIDEDYYDGDVGEENSDEDQNEDVGFRRLRFTFRKAPAS